MPLRSRKPERSPAEPVALGDALSQLFATRGYGRIQGDRQIREVWANVVGDDIQRQTRVSGIKNGVLHVGVDNSAVLSELVGFQKSEILGKLQHAYPDLRIRDIKFRLESRRRQSKD